MVGGCMARGVYGRGGICGEGMWMVGEGACVVRGMRGRVHVCVAVEMATATDGTHPTGMHSSDCVFYPYFQGFMEGRSLLVVYVFYFSRLSERSPMERRAPAQSSSRDQCTRGPSSGTTRTQFLF